MRNNMDALLEAARKVTMSSEQREAQRRSFAYGNAAIENDQITRDMIDVQADLMAPHSKN